MQNLLGVICNRRIHEVGASRAEKLSASDLAVLKNDIDWTDELHARMGAQFPQEEGAE